MFRELQHHAKRGRGRARARHVLGHHAREYRSMLGYDRVLRRRCGCRVHARQSRRGRGPPLPNGSRSHDARFH